MWSQLLSDNDEEDEDDEETDEDTDTDTGDFLCSITRSLDSCLDKNTLIFILWFTALWQLYLAYRQFLLVQRTERPPDVLKFAPTEKYQIGRNYIMDKIKLSMVNCIYAVTLSTLEIYHGIYSIYWDLATTISSEESIQNFIWFTILITVYVILDTPFSLYDTLIENRYGMRSRTSNAFLSEELKLFFAMILVSLPTIYFLVSTLNSSSFSFFLWIWFVTILIVLLAVTVSPSYIAFFLTVHIPIQRGALRNSIIELGQQYKLCIAEIYLVNGNTQTAHKNVQITGMWGGRNIILHSSLLPKPVQRGGLNNNELLAIISHEIGHWYFKHYHQLFPVLVAYYASIFSLYSYFFHSSNFYVAIGFQDGARPKMAGLVGIALYILTPFNTVASFFKNYFTRRLEYQADEFVVNNQKGNDLKNGLGKANENIMYCIFDSWYSCWNIDHPTLYERLVNINRLQNACTAAPVCAGSLNFDPTAQQMESQNRR